MSSIRGWAAVSAVAAVLLAGGCGAGGAGGAPEQVTVRVAAAASLQYAFGDIIDGFSRDRPGVRVELSYGSSGGLYQQLANGAPFDLFLAADLSYPQRLVDDGVAAEADLFRYAEGRLVVWAGDGSPVDPGVGIEAVGDARRVAIANPAHAPYGQAAEAALRAAGLYDRVADRLLVGDSVAQTAQFVAAGNAEIGLVAMSQVMAPALQDVGRWREVPAELFPRLDHGGLVPAAAGAAEPARALRDFLRSPAGVEILQRYGFDPPSE